MISIDRSSSISVTDQLLQQLRYQIAGGRYKAGDTLPSTRSLAEQIGVSFHTVRKAYHQLEREGLLQVRAGSGFEVQERTTGSKAERMERGAQIIHQALQQLVSAGLDENEIESIFHEQLDLLDEAHEPLKLVFAAESSELAALYASQISQTLQRDVQGVSFDELPQHQDADFVFTPCSHLRAVLGEIPRADVMGVSTYLKPDALERVARLLPHETLGMIASDARTIPSLIAELRNQAGFDGQLLAISLEDTAVRVNEFVRQVDLLLYTPPSRRRLLSAIDEASTHTTIAPVISRESLEAIRASVPGW